MATMIETLAYFVNLLFNAYFWIIVVRIILTWIPSINWQNQPFKAIAAMADLLLAPFRKIIPAVGGIDFSPLVALLLFSIVQGLVIRLIMAFV